MNDATDLLTRPLFAAARLVWWVVEEFLFHIVLWCTGWPICRAVTFGRFPETGFGDGEQAGTGEVVLVCGVGLLMLVAVGWLFFA